MAAPVDTSKLQASYAALQSAFNAGAIDAAVAPLTELRVALAPIVMGLAHRDTPSLIMARDVWEMAALLAARSSDFATFERLFFQVSTLYPRCGTSPASNRQGHLLALHLLFLLTENRMADFHAALARLDKPEKTPTDVHMSAVDSSQHIGGSTLSAEADSDLIADYGPEVGYVAQLERWLSGGAYNKVLKEVSSNQSSDAAGLFTVLSNTVRAEIATGIETAYAPLKIDAAGRLLQLHSKADLDQFASQRGWRVSPCGQKYCFPEAVASCSTMASQNFGASKSSLIGDVMQVDSDNAKDSDQQSQGGLFGPSADLLFATLAYAQELDQIV
ncbi:hypothetical protein H696_02467 [Fonticula alba]|uniref:CSN8/PSMD8/EIF3K domain-containing protein n=1 Tax=Fonticula alba TaxID=691883 RepID=A0A058ZAT5_FONAL|nr:hypothetical protein H696_02467 [Fonticula alba]KCV71530.1 hypothetical protein H696_02467 [Fonticula alba]|eukprot:XP_009494653.1 hypothetical protein H696_02467 [Fonticula alba]